jgi:hypothetical protein
MDKPINKIRLIILLLIALCFISTTAHSQSKNSSTKPSIALTEKPRLKQTLTKHEVRRFGYGGDITILGGPTGSVTIEGWTRNEVDITVNIEIEANSEKDLAEVASVTGFLIDEDANHIRILTTGMHDKKTLQKRKKSISKELLNLPWRVDYQIRAPILTDLEIYAGNGELRLAGIEGNIAANLTDTNAKLALTGGHVNVIASRGAINVEVISKSWRGRGLDVKLATGNIDIKLPTNFNIDLNGSILRSGRIENTHPGLLPREREPNNQSIVNLRGGIGGPILSFTVGDGTIQVKSSEK